MPGVWEEALKEEFLTKLESLWCSPKHLAMALVHCDETVMVNSCHFHSELLKDKEFLAYAIAKVDKRISELKSELEKKINEYKKNALKESAKRLRG